MRRSSEAAGKSWRKWQADPWQTEMEDEKLRDQLVRFLAFWAACVAVGAALGLIVR